MLPGNVPNTKKILPSHTCALHVWSYNGGVFAVVMCMKIAKLIKFMHQSFVALYLEEGVFMKKCII